MSLSVFVFFFVINDDQRGVLVGHGLCFLVAEFVFPEMRTKTRNENKKFPRLFSENRDFSVSN